MIKEFVSQQVIGTVWPIVVMLASLTCFLLVTYWVFKGGKDRFKRESALPLDDGTVIRQDNSENNETTNESAYGERA